MKNEKTNKVENTTKTAKENPESILLEAMLRGGSGQIEAMEARGTAQLEISSVLPSDGLIEEKSRRGNHHREWAEKCGIKIFDLVEGDELFVNIELPPGWRQKCTDHAMWNDLLDEQGRRRAGIFYKAAFYDRKAHIQPAERFTATYESRDDPCNRECWGIVRDCDREIWRGEILPPAKSVYNPHREELFAQVDVARDQATNWLDERYPNYKDPSAYWDLE